MHKFAYLNARLVAAAEAHLPALSAGALYGKGVFTTIAIYGGIPFLWEKHWRRVSANAETLGIDITGHTETEVGWSIGQLIKSNEVKGGRARLTFFDETPGGLWSFESTRKTGLLITTADRGETGDDLVLTFSPYALNSSSPLAGVKSCNYLDKLLALNEAKKRGFDEAVRLNERGEIASACMANIFWLKDGKLFTPSLKSGALAGTTREFVLENLECVEIDAHPDSLKRADAIFLTSAGLGVKRIKELDGIKFRGDHEILRLISEY